MTFRGKLKDLSFTRDGNQIVSIETGSDISELFDELSNTEIDVTLKKHRERRSNDANAYCWILCGKIAEKLSDEDPQCTKETVYRQAIREVGVYKDFVNIEENDAKTLRHAWEMLGTGWITEQVDYSHDGELVTIRCYYGSSTYNTKCMSRLIDNLVQDAQALGIPTDTPEQIEKIKSLWAQEPPERKGNNE